MTVSSSLAERILTAIAKCSAQAPARASEVRRRLSACAEVFDAAIAELSRTCQINSAEISRGDEAAWLAIWPTGVIRPAGAWSNQAKGSLFEPQKPMREVTREVHAPRVRPAAPKAAVTATPAPADRPASKLARRRRAPGEVEPEILAMIAGRCRAQAISRREIAEGLGATGTNPLANYSAAINRVVEQTPWVASVRQKSGRQVSHCLFDSRASSEAPPAEVALPVDAPSGTDSEAADGRPINDSVAAHLERDGTLTVSFGPDYATERCVVHVRAIRAELGKLTEEAER